MGEPITSPALFVHIRVFMGIVLGLSVARLLTGLARFVQHPSREQVYLTHLLWVLTVLMMLAQFWWFEFQLHEIRVWRFELFLFVLFYASLFFLLCALLFPDRMDEYSGYRDYFLSRRKWFFGLLALIFAVDLADSAIKGMDHFRSLGLEYPIASITIIALCFPAIALRGARLHAGFAALVLIHQLVWTLRHFHVLS
jgi:hypothetical protein